MYVCIYISNQPSVHPPIQSFIHANEDIETWSHPPHKTYSPQNQENHMHQTARAGREGLNTKDSSVTSMLQLVDHDTAPRQLVCYSWYYCLKYQGTEYNPSARVGTLGHIINGIYLYPCYSWHIRPYFQRTLLYTPAIAGTSGHIINGIYLIPLLQLAHQTILPMDFTVYPCYSWHIRPYYQWTLLYTPATASTTGHITNGLYCIPLLQLAHQAILPMDFTVYSCYI